MNIGRRGGYSQARRDVTGLRTVVIVNLAAAIGGLVFTLALYAGWRRDPWLLVVTVGVGFVCAALVIALIQHDRGLLPAAVLMVASANLAISIIASWVAPVAALITPLVCVLPVVLAVPFLTGRALAALAGATVATTFAVACLGQLQRGAGLEATAPRWITDGVCYVFVPLTVALICLAAWNNHSAVLARAEEVRESRARVVSATDQARLRLERVVQGGALQRLVSAPVNIGSACKQLCVDVTEATRLLDVAQKDLLRAIAELRALAAGIYPSVLATHGIVDALESLARRTPGRVIVTSRDVGRYESSVEASAYFLCVEIIRHALAHEPPDTLVRVVVTGGTDLTLALSPVALTVEGDQDSADGDLDSVRDRVGALGASLEAGRGPHDSTTLTVRIPAHHLPDTQDRSDEASTVDPGATSSGTGREAVTHRLYKMNVVVTIQSALFVAVAYFAFGRHWAVLAIELATLTATAGLWHALRLHRRGDEIAAVLWSLGMFWGFQITIVTILPVTVAYATVVCLLPVLMAVTCLSYRSFRRIGLLAVALSIVLVTLGRAQHWISLQGTLPAWFINVVVIQYVSASVAVVCLAAWHNHAAVLSIEHELRQSRARVVAALDDARFQLERDLHDGAQGHLVTANVILGAGQRLIPDDLERARSSLEHARAILRQGAAQVRSLARGVYPNVLTEHGLVEALNVLARREDGRVVVGGHGIGRYDQLLEAGVYFACHEAIQNALKHSDPSSVVQVLLASNGELTVQVRDSGPGFEVTTQGRGLSNMRDRIGALGGSLEISSSPGQQTIVAIKIPTDTPHAQRHGHGVPIDAMTTS